MSESPSIVLVVVDDISVRESHLPAYLEEMTFGFNRRRSKTIFLETLQHMFTADPLSYKKLTA
jgi:hypothetical protein